MVIVCLEENKWIIDLSCCWWINVPERCGLIKILSSDDNVDVVSVFWGLEKSAALHRDHESERVRFPIV